MSLHDKHLSCNALGILYPIYRLAALVGLQPSLLQYRAWVLVSLEIQYHPAPSYPAAAASRRHKFSAIIFGRPDSPFQMAFLGLWPTLHMHPRLRLSTMLQHPDSPERVSTIEVSIRFAILAQRLLPRGLCDSCPTMLHMSIRIEVSARAQARCLKYNRVWRIEQETVKTLN
jgi:hypothetical protein